jgi:hypothetical protein
MIAVSPNGNYLALMCENGLLVFMSCSFDTKLLEFETTTAALANQLAWCGEVSGSMCGGGGWGTAPACM